MDMSGMVVIITGASDGLGLETAKSLYGMGAQLVLPVRNLTKGQQAQESILASSASRHAPFQALAAAGTHLDASCLSTALCPFLPWGAEYSYM